VDLRALRRLLDLPAATRGALHSRQATQEGKQRSRQPLGYIALAQDDTREAKAFFEKSLRAGRGLENWRNVPRILSGLAWSASEDGDFEQAQKLCKEALKIHWEQGEALGAASVLNSMGYIELAWGNQERASESFEKALTLGRELEHEWTVSLGLSGLGLTANLQGDPERAKTLLKDSLAIYLQLERKAEPAEYMEGLAEAAGALGQDVRAARLWGAAATIRRADRPWSPTERLLHEPLLATARSRMNEAVWESAFAEGEAMNIQEAVEYALSEEDDAAISTSQAPDESVDLTQQPALAHRKEEVAALVARGLTNRQIATELMISEHTAATHVRRILKKLGLQSRSQIGLWLTQQQL
jgi:DNA-binding CsgD family transcriptional regulator/Tfp pilus assembly protein PilF